MRFVFRVLFPYFMMFVSSVAVGGNLKYKLYYHPDIGILYDTESKQISALCESLTGILNIIDLEPHLGHQSSILVGTEYHLDIVIAPRMSRDHPPFFSVSSVHPKFRRVAERLIYRYFFEWSKFSRPPKKWLRQYMVNQENGFNAQSNREAIYQLSDAADEAPAYQLYDELTNARGSNQSPIYQEVDARTAFDNPIYDGRFDGDAPIALDQVGVELGESSRVSTLETSRGTNPQARFGFFRSGAEEVPRLIPLPERCPTHEESLRVILRQADPQAYLLSCRDNPIH